MIYEYKTAHFFCGIGGAAVGMQKSIGEYKGAVGRFRTLVGIDCDKQACEDFERITGAPAAQMDLFSREDYITFHGKEPPADWQEITPDDIFNAAGREYPHVVFLSPPCKGFSGLLPQKSASTPKYQALNRLTIRGIELMLRAFELDLPGIILFENVPRIKTRGDKLLGQIRKLLKSYGYEIVPKRDEIHDCGEIGGLGQRRKRYLLIARHPEKVSSFIYKPPVLPLKTIGDVIGPLPFPDDQDCGPLHRLPRLQWKTWVRLALIPAGGDWRDLQKIAPEQYRIEHIPRNASLGVQEWDKPSDTVIGNMRVGGSSASAIPDPRMELNENATHKAIYRVTEWGETANTVTGAYRPNNGAIVIPDPRLKERESRHGSVYRIVNIDEPAPCVTGTRFGSGAIAIADPRFTEQRFSNYYQLSEWDEAAGTVTGRPNMHSGAQSIADPRLNCSPRSGMMGVQKWDEPSATITAAADIHTTAVAVADPRVPADNEKGAWIIIAPDGTWHRPLTTYELAALQGLDLTMQDGSPLTLSGNSDSRWREAIGNMVPPPAAQAMGNQILIALLASETKDWYLSTTDIWVLPNQQPEIAAVIGGN